MDGKVAIRAGHWVKPDKSNDLSFIVNKLKRLVELFFRTGTCEVIGSSDGDLNAEAMQQIMDSFTRTKYGTPWFHFMTSVIS